MRWARHFVWRVIALIIIYIIYTPIILSDFVLDGVMSPDKFGPVNPRINDMSFCRGPKKTNCTDIALEQVDGFNNLTFRLTFKKPTHFIKAKMAIWRDNASTPDITKWIDKPCRHFFLAPILKQYLKASNNCVVPKGKIAASLNITSLFHELMGFQFFYGSYRSQTQVMSNDCNIACIVTEFVLERKISGKGPKT